ncbi:atypical/RIO/RIO2 protein kinase [Cercophora scortea]|uniref:Serine/threonine-protein kinase RIO2 n=1 Tax=Cercophora scortea TaxID=314031 RepID=A0AAE0IE38_9PEZI|nr:atypical/RIO/RIO2 protein kinase [Cercophora scortea]
MKLDTRVLRHLTQEDWKVLAAVEQGTKNHENVPTVLIEKLSRLKGGASGVHKSISALAKASLVAKTLHAKYDGYRLTYGGLDYLALHQHAQRKQVYSVGSRIGVGKESDIMVVADDAGVQKVLKIHRLGRISFRTVKANRDYLKSGQAGSWMYLSQLAAMKEFAFMRALRDEGFLVPEPISQSRHTILMTLIDALPMRQISMVPDPASLYADLIAILLRLAQHGLIHGDFNEFNILIKEERTPAALSTSTSTPSASTSTATSTSTQTSSAQPATADQITLVPVIIDFPQMVSMDHVNAEMYFDRDVACIKRFFKRRFHFTATQPGPFFKDAKKTVGKDGARRLDATAEASGFTKKMAKDLERAIALEKKLAEEKAELKKESKYFGADSDEDFHDDDDDDDQEEDDSEDDDEAEEEEGGQAKQQLDDDDIPTFPRPEKEIPIEKLTISEAT